MKILVKTYCAVYNVLENKHQSTHGSSYCPFQWRQIFRDLGHQCDFIGPKAVAGEVVTDPTGYDVLFFWGNESMVWDMDYASTLLTQFKGKKIWMVSSPCGHHEMMVKFDAIVGTDMPEYVPHVNKFKGRCKVKSLWFYYAAPCFDLVDADNSDPYHGEKGKVTYMGIIKPFQLPIFNYLAGLGIPLVIGGTWYPDGAKEGVRGFTPQEMKDWFHPSIQFYSKDARFLYGDHFKFLKHADCALNFNLKPGDRSCNSKIIDYLVCGTPTISEDGSANSYHIPELEAGYLVPNRDNAALYHAIRKVLDKKWDRDLIQKKARERFNPLTIGKQVLDATYAP